MPDRSVVGWILRDGKGEMKCLREASSISSFNSADNSCWSPPYDSNPPPYQTHALPHSPQFLTFPRKTALLPRTMLTRSVEV
ncbi:hypothetical protein F2Q68_00026878 [Brassica cretica]|uniref:Uncharacterized protein n=1 Tax=Brassica cretica TaxID=69181 RepID=A0A8S9IKI5_BRACR|nr:hypothetical protein F2Q68_00026878 [Brassica cretica]